MNKLATKLVLLALGVTLLVATNIKIEYGDVQKLGAMISNSIGAYAGTVRKTEPEQADEEKDESQDQAADQRQQPDIRDEDIWLQPYLKFHKASISMNASKKDQIDSLYWKEDISIPDSYLTWVCLPDRPLLCGGIGDRFKGIAATFFLAMCTNRTFFIHSDRPDPITKYLAPNLIQWDAFHAIPPKTKGFDLFNKRTHQYNKDPQSIPTKYKAMQVYANYFPAKYLPTTSCVRQLQQQFPQSSNIMNFTDMEGSVLRALFRFSDNLTDHVVKMKKRANLTATTPDGKHPAPYIGIHVRTGNGLRNEIRKYPGKKDRIKHEQQRHSGSQNLQKFIDCANKVQQEMVRCYGLQGLPEMYLATDDFNTKTIAPTMDKTGSIRTLNDLHAFHIDLSVYNKSIPGADLPVVETWGEVAILTNATCLVAGRSGYSKVAEQFSPQQPRCSVHFEHCDDAQVKATVEASLQCRSSS